MLRVFRFKLVIGILGLAFFVPTLLLSFLYAEPHRQARFFRKVSILMIRAAFFGAGIRIKAGHHRKGQFIYAPNHPTMSDGFVMQAIVGPDVVPLVAPLAQFAFIFRLWMRRMGSIDITRDLIDQALYPGSNTKEEALHKCLEVLKQGYSLLIFPEGHTEHLEALYYFHTGVARLSLASGVAVQPTVIRDSHLVFINSFVRTKNTVSVTFGTPVIPEKAYGWDIVFTKHESLRAMVRDYTSVIENEILRSLPLRQRTDQRRAGSNIGVFVDIDMTIYRGLSQVDFLLFLYQQRKVPLKFILYAGLLFSLENIGIISHESMVRKALSYVKGWRTDTLKLITGRFFRQLALPKIEYSLYAILEDHLAKEHHLVFVTETTHPMAKMFTEFFHADGAIDSSLRARGKTYTGEISFLCYGANKAQGVMEFARRHRIDLSKSYAYADSFSDAAFLETVGHPAVIHPDHRLKQFARSHGVPVLKGA